MCVICGTPTYDDVCGECVHKCKKYDEIVELCNKVITDYANAIIADKFDAGYCSAMLDVRAKIQE